jgi:cell division cycle 2-like protein
MILVLADDSDDTESDRRASDADDDDTAQKKNGTEDGHKDRDRPHSDSDLAPAENGNISTPPLPAAEANALSDLPPYLPAIQGCRSVEEFFCLNRCVAPIY